MKKLILLTVLVIASVAFSQDDKWQDKRIQGIDFIAAGSNPTWFLEVDFESKMTFTNIMESSTPAPVEVPIKYNNTTIYYAKNESNELVVEVFEKECADSITGEKFPFTVTVSGKLNFSREYFVYKGCGKYLVDNRLNGTWYIDKLNSDIIDPEMFTKEKRPVIQIDINKLTMIGSAGCNTFDGSFETKGDRIKFPAFSITQMNCQDMKTEEEFLKIFRYEDFNMKIEDNKLMFLRKGTVVMELKKE